MLYLVGFFERNFTPSRFPRNDDSSYKTHHQSYHTLDRLPVPLGGDGGDGCDASCEGGSSSLLRLFSWSDLEK